jgi:hypothetical protein
MDLSVESPLSPLLANAVAHDHPRDIVVSALVLLVCPTFDDCHAHHLHVEQLGLIAEAGHIAYECLATPPRTLSVLGEH